MPDYFTIFVSACGHNLNSKPPRQLRQSWLVAEDQLSQALLHVDGHELRTQCKRGKLAEAD